MHLVMTLMVRDEADVIGAMLEHHARQGVDVFIITDNGSVDGTTEIIKSFAERATVDLRIDPEHRKQQTFTVTKMARDAASIHKADWVINADADEFWFPVDRKRTLKDVFSEIPKSLGSFTVPVHDMIGAPALSGSGLSRLIYRDQRSDEMLRSVGLRSHSTPDAVHIGDPQIVVAQGNHSVNLASTGEPDPALAIEVMHFPWRSWQQYHRKVENAGRAYANNSGLSPSPNHHGMREYRRLQDGLLQGAYIARHPNHDELAEGLESGWFVVDTGVAAEDLPGATDSLYSEETIAFERAIAATTRVLEERMNDAEVQRIAVVNERDGVKGELNALRARLEDLEAETAERNSRPLVRASNLLARVRRRLARQIARSR
ncbi:MAG: glycosyltransferase family 2 protein [Rhodoglobus sp.]